MTTISDPSAMTPDDPRWLSWFMQQRRFDRLSRKAQTGASLITDFAAGVYEMGYPGQRRGSYELSDIVKVSRSTGGGIINQLGQFEWVSDGVARLTYDPVTLQPLGLLIEEQRTNLYLNSNDFTQSSWIKSKCTVAVSGSSPVGVAHKLTMVNGAIHSANDASGIFVGGTSGTAGNRTLTFFAKAAEVTSLRLRNNSSGALTAVDLTTGLATFGDYLKVTTASFGDGWWRISATADTTNRLDQWSVRSGVTGDGVSGFLIAGFGFEEASFSTSYIPTTTAQVTRAADVCSVNTLSPWFNATEGAIVVKFVPGTPGTGIKRVFSISDGTINNRIDAFLSSSAPPQVRTLIASAGVEQANFGSQAAPLGARSSFAMSYKADNITSALNGVISGSDLLAGIPSGLTLLSVGRNSTASAGAFLDGIIASLEYYPRVIDVQQVSA